MGEFLQVVKYQEAVERLKKYFPSRAVIEVHLLESAGRVLAAEVNSPEDIPSFHRSTVDGYAVNAEDSFGASESLPAFLEFKGEVMMGQEAGLTLKKGQCSWIPTGGMLPEGTNAAVMVEYTEKLGNDTVLVYRPVGPGENVMLKGEDIRAGQALFIPGKRLRSQDIGLAASLGIQKLPVYEPYRVGIISTGNEIVPMDQKPMIGQVRDVNTYSLASAVKSYGSIAHHYSLVLDDFDALKQAVEKGLAENDVLLLSGGSSVGVMDVTLDVLLDFEGAELLFHGLAVKPGKPTIGVKIGSKLVIGLPGHPVSALMMFYIVCAPFLAPEAAQSIWVKSGQNIASQAGRDDFIPVFIENSGPAPIARPLLGKSGLMSILAQANAYIHIPYEQQGIAAGEDIKAYLF